MNVKVIHTKNIRWIDIVNPGHEELGYLKSNFNLHPLDFEDITSTSEHPKIEERDNYRYIVLLFPVYDRKTGIILPAEIDMFVSKDFVITIHDGQMYTMTSIYDRMNENPELRRQFMSKNGGYLLYYILESLFKRAFPMLDHINKDMTQIEENIFSRTDVKMLETISKMKRNIIDFRRIMKTHHLILRRLMNAKEPYMIFAGSKELYTNILEHSENIWDIVAIQKETIEALQDANQSLAASELNNITKTFTIISGVFLPATLVIFIFGLHAKGMPFIEDSRGFIEILLLACLASVLMTLYFKGKKWF